MEKPAPDRVIASKFAKIESHEHVAPGSPDPLCDALCTRRGGRGHQAACKSESKDMEIDDQMRRFFGTDDLGAVSPEGCAARRSRPMQAT
jgi:hypothetical protein